MWENRLAGKIALITGAAQGKCILDKFGKIDVLVNNAGITKEG